MKGWGRLGRFCCSCLVVSDCFWVLFDSYLCVCAAYGVPIAQCLPEEKYDSTISFTTMRLSCLSQFQVERYEVFFLLPHGD